MEKRKIIPIGAVAFLAIVVLTVGLVSAIAAEPMIMMDVVPAIAAIGITLAMGIGAAVRLAKWNKARPPFKWLPVDSVNAIALAMDTVNANYLYATKRRISTGPQSFTRNNGFLRKI